MYNISTLKKTIKCKELFNSVFGSSLYSNILCFYFEGFKLNRFML